LIDDKEKRAITPLELVDAHIDAIKAAVRDDIKSDEHPAGRVLVLELERRVKEVGAYAPHPPDYITFSSGSSTAPYPASGGRTSTFPLSRRCTCGCTVTSVRAFAR